MPIRRRAIRLRVVRRRRYAAARRPARSLVVKKLINSNVHKFNRTIFYNGAISGSTVVDTFGAQYFRLVDIPNYTEFTNLFDMYRIDAVKITFMPRGNSAEVGTNQGLVKFFSVIDYDDITTPTAINDLLQYENLKVTNTAKNHSRTIRPKLAKAMYQTAIGTAYGAGTGWVDCANPTVPHYGLKWALQQLPAGTQNIDIMLKFYMSFKNVV